MATQHKSTQVDPKSTAYAAWNLRTFATYVDLWANFCPPNASPYASSAVVRWLASTCDLRVRLARPLNYGFDYSPSPGHQSACVTSAPPTVLATRYLSRKGGEGGELCASRLCAWYKIGAFCAKIINDKILENGNRCAFRKHICCIKFISAVFRFRFPHTHTPTHTHPHPHPHPHPRS